MFKLFNLANKKSKNIFKLIFDIENSNIETIITHNDYSENNAEKIAMILYALNNGLLLNLIIQSLNDKVDIDQNFVQLVLDKLNSYYKIDDINSIVVKPLDAFQKNAKH